jgi:putative transposase
VRSQSQRGEVVVLRRRVGQLEKEAEIARRLVAFEDQGPDRSRIWRFIEKESAHFAITTLCRACRVSRSAYYEWIDKGEGPSEADVDEAILANQIYDTWAKSRRRYGAPRITAALRKGGDQVNDKRVARLMGLLGIAGICGGKKIKTTRRDPSHPLAADLVERDFSAEGPDELWLTGITYIATDEGWLYLCSILDVFSRRLLGWSMADHLRTELCLDALDGAAMVRGRHRFVGTVLHSDHGCQYTSDDFKARCKALGIVQSMGATGSCRQFHDGERVVITLRELVYETHFSTKDEARMAVFEWLDWYNNERLHSSIDYMSPMESEESRDNQEAA